MSEREQFEAWARSDVDLRITLESEVYAGIAWMAWQASREALKAENGGDSELLASAKIIEQSAIAIVQSLKQPAGDGWIVCADRMPERGGQYCVWNGAHVGLVTYLFGSFQCLYPEQITHWQPQPAPPSHHPIDTAPNQYDALGKGGEQ